MADVQILRAPADDVPSNYVLPNAAELRLKAVYAEFTDNGASGNWLPCVTIISDSGDVIGRAVDPGVMVTAGSDADVTWFPGVKRAGAALSAANQWPFAYECIDLGSLQDGTGKIAPAVPYWTNGGWVTTVDATYYRGFYFDSTNVPGEQIVFVMRLGGKGSVWCVQPVCAFGPAEGKLKIEFAQSPYGEDAPGAGDPNDFGIIYDPNFLPHPIDLTAPGVTWYTCSPFELDLGAVALNKIGVSGTLSQFRIMGDSGSVLSANATATPGRGYTALDFRTGGPGIWYMRMTNEVGSTGASRVRISSLRVVRQTGFDFMTV